MSFLRRVPVRPVIFNKVQIQNYSRRSSKTSALFNQESRKTSFRDIKDPNINDKIPDLPPSNPGQEDWERSNLSVNKTSDGVLFPWYYNGQVPSITKKPTFITNHLPLVSVLPDFLAKPLARLVGILSFPGVNSMFSNSNAEFLTGCQLAFTKFTETVTANDTQVLRRMLTPSLFELYVNALDKLNKEGGSVEIEVLKVTDSIIVDRFYIAGPQEGLKLKDPNYIPIFIGNYIMVSPLSAPEKNVPIKDRILEAQNNLTSGFQLQLQVAIDAKVHYKLSNTDGVLIDDTSNRTFNLLFECDYIEPAHELFTSPETMNWTWKIADIDFLDIQRTDYPRKLFIETNEKFNI